MTDVIFDPEGTFVEDAIVSPRTNLRVRNWACSRRLLPNSGIGGVGVIEKTFDVPKTVTGLLGPDGSKSKCCHYRRRSNGVR